MQVLHEMELVKTLKEFSNQLQNSLDNIHKYTHEVNKVKKGEMKERKKEERKKGEINERRRKERKEK